jgi:putative transposase
MDDVDSLSHSRWECKYHIVFIPKCRRKVLYGQLRSHLGAVFHKLARHTESRIEEGHLMADHVHMLISIPPKYAVDLARVYGERQRNDRGQHVWTRGYFASTVGEMRH